MSIETEVSEFLRRGSTFADNWPESVRKALHVQGGIQDAVVEAINAGTSVVVTGNAGDGKSHLAQAALRDLKPKVVGVAREEDVSDADPAEGVLFLRDASTLLTESALGLLDRWMSAGVPFLMTINEGPLQLLGHGSSPASISMQQVASRAHERAQGRRGPDPEGILVVNLAGRHLTRCGFTATAIDRLLPHVTPCAVCASRDRACARTLGARMLGESSTGKQRLESLLRLVSDQGVHLTARRIWTFLVELFLDDDCPDSPDPIQEAVG